MSFRFYYRQSFKDHDITSLEHLNTNTNTGLTRHRPADKKRNDDIKSY